MNNNKTKNLIFTSMCIALAVVLPVFLHSVPNAGSILLPMHIPVLLCGLALGAPYGLACGLLAPVLSSLVTGMPPFAYLPAMTLELAAYGLVSGLLSKHLHLGNRMVNIYVNLILAMLIGRIVYGISNALIFMAGAYSFEIFISAAFITALPGIIIQLIIIPPMLLLLERANIISVKA